MSDGETQLAARWHGRRDVRVEAVAAPAAPGPGMATVEVALCGICGTDVGEYLHGPFVIRTSPHPLTGQAPPVTLGHELSGRVVATGDGVEIEPGTRVTADAAWRCGHCRACLRGDYHLCEVGASLGLHSDGAFARLVAVPAYALVPLPDSVSDAQASMTEPLAVGLHALERAELRAGDDVLVLGFGPIGAATALMARAFGARARVVEKAPGRAAAAERLGFETLAVGDDLPRRLRATVHRRGVDVVVECTGVAGLIDTAVDCADRGGRIVLAGLIKTPEPIDTRALTIYERSLIGSIGYRYDLPRVVEMMASGALDPTPLIGETIGIDAVPAMLERLATDPGETIKVLVAP